MFYLVVYNIRVVCYQHESLCSISEGEEESHTSSNPDCLLFTARKFDHEAEVGRVTSCRQGARTGQDLVDGALVDASDWLLSVLLGQEPDQWELSVELLGNGVVQEVSLGVPTSTFHVHTIDEATVFRRLRDGGGCGIVTDLEVI